MLYYNFNIYKAVPASVAHLFLSTWENRQDMNFKIVFSFILSLRPVLLQEVLSLNRIIQLKLTKPEGTVERLYDRDFSSLLRE